MAADNSQQNQTAAQYSQVYSLRTPPGIQRDGTPFQAARYTDGVWCRFQRLLPKKIGGYKSIFQSLVGIYRGMIVQPYNGVNYLFAGNYQELDVFTTGTSLAFGSGPFAVNILPGQVPIPLVSNTTTAFVVSGDLTSRFPAGTNVIFTQTGTPTNYVVSTSSYSSPNTTVNITSGTISGTPSTVYINNAPVFTPDTDNQISPSIGDYKNNWQFDTAFSPEGGQLSVLAHPGKNLNNIDSGIKSQVLVGQIVPQTGYQWNFNGLSDSAGANPTYQPIEVDGGVCMLYPFIFVYGSNGFIANNNVNGVYNNQSFYDWNGPLANQVNLSASKIVRGTPMRGGTNSPSGLFWATDSLIRVTFNPAGSASSTIPSTYWNYDIVANQTSIMSSSAVVELDGCFWWMGTDRFYVYNGQVQRVDNDTNINYVFDNINYEQRQKVWATKVPRYNEIWFFYPRGTATECTDAIIYNTKDKIWYDAGQAAGARRSCGYTTELLPNPIWFGWDYEPSFSKPQTIIAHPASLPAPNANQFYLTGDQTSAFSPGGNVSFTDVNTFNQTYTIASSQNIYNTVVTPPGVTLVTCTENFMIAPTPGESAYVVQGGFNVWQHEYGQNQVNINGEDAIYSSVTTNDISWISGSPAGENDIGTNRRMHLRRIEPNFLQTGTMSVTVLGRKFPNGSYVNDEEDSGPYYFDPDTGKIDLRVESRLIRLQFTSNVIDGNFEMGRLLITCEFGDERP